jgi:NADH:ubiquinone oxidoreductase subunit F (NADH-binding)
MQINLWGAVKNAGRYEVPISTTLIDLLSFAGGPAGGADISSVRVVRSVRRGLQVRRVEYELDLDRLDLLDDKALDLEPEDTIIIDSVDWSFRDVVTVFTTAAVIVAATASIINATNR